MQKFEIKNSKLRTFSTLESQQIDRFAVNLMILLWLWANLSVPFPLAPKGLLALLKTSLLYINLEGLALRKNFEKKEQ